MYRIHEIKLSLGEEKSAIPGKIVQKLSLSSTIEEWKIVKESLDARDKGAIQYVYTVDFETKEENPKLVKSPNVQYETVSPGTDPLTGRPVIAGFGPCGMFAALVLAELGYRPLVIERGKPIEQRVLDVELFWREGVLNEESNVQFGEGGAGTFSDGKLTTGIKDPRAQKVLSVLAAAGAGEEILYQQKPHIGTDLLREIVPNIRKKIQRCGGEILFDTKLTGLQIDEKGQLIGVFIEEMLESKRRLVETERLILAIGHSARDTVRMLFDSGMMMEQKPFSIGVRIEHPQQLIDLAQYGKGAPSGLPSAEYKLAHHCASGRGVYTFCMCPGGEVIVASSVAGGVVTNGMSLSKRDGAFANSGFLVDVRPSDFETEHPLSGIIFQEKYEQIAFQQGGSSYKAPQTTWEAFSRGAEEAIPVIRCLPDFAVSAMREAMPHFARKIKGFDCPDARLYAVESRSSSPVRIKRDVQLHSSIFGILPAGEGAGYAGGIVSAAVDGIRAAEEIVKNFKGTGPLE